MRYPAPKFHPHEISRISVIKTSIPQRGIRCQRDIKSFVAEKSGISFEHPIRSYEFQGCVINSFRSKESRRCTSFKIISSADEQGTLVLLSSFVTSGSLRLKWSQQSLDTRTIDS